MWIITLEHMHLTTHLWPQHVAHILRIPIMCRQQLILPLNGFLYHMYLSTVDIICSDAMFWNTFRPCFNPEETYCKKE